MGGSASLPDETFSKASDPLKGIASVLSSNELKCESCDRSFICPTSLKKHKETVHGKGGAKLLSSRYDPKDVRIESPNFNAMLHFQQQVLLQHM